MSARHKWPPKSTPEPTGQTIQLLNPVSDQFEGFIFGNAVQWEEMAMAKLQEHAPHEVQALAVLAAKSDAKMEALRTVTAAFRAAIDRSGSDPCVVQQDSAKGRSVVICGAGPSLRDAAAEWVPKADQVWGCNSALPWLLDHGYTPTHGVTVDQTPSMLEEWQRTPDVEYLLATTVHPHLVELLRQRNRRVRLFHNYVGIKQAPVKIGREFIEYEQWLYQLYYPGTIMAGSGLNTVTRAIDVAQYMGFTEITILGADCALRVTAPQPDAPMGSPEHTAWLRESVEMHADGGHALSSGATAVTMSAEIDGRTWVTKPDLAISAQWLVQMAKKHKAIRLVGDTLPNAIYDKPDEFMRRLPQLTDSKGRPIRYAA